MSVTAARGWRAAACHAGTKPSGQLDLALVLSDRPAAVAGAFTTNRVAGGHIHVCRPRVASGRARGVLVSAGISNSATGPEGVRDAERMAALAARAAGVPPEEMLVCSTGTIGNRIPVDDIAPAIDKLPSLLGPRGEEAARAIMTTDTRPKVAVRTLRAGGGTVTVGGMAKGAGMINPRLAVAHATMLAFITSDASAPPQLLREALAAALPSTFNAITVDGATSTCDTVLLFANGAAGVPAPDGFADAVREVMAELAYAIAADGEGSTKVVRIEVSGAASDSDAEAAARAVAGNLLFRCSLWGGVPTWGRVMQALGQAPLQRFAEGAVRIAIGGVVVAEGGISTGREAEAAARIAPPEVQVAIDLGQGTASYQLLTCDLSPDYVRLNAD